MKKSFVLYLDQYEPIKDLTDEQKGQLLDAMFKYHDGNELTHIDPFVKFAFSFFKQTFERDNAKYVKTCEKNRENARIRWDAKNATASERMPSDAKNADSDSGSDKIVIVTEDSDNKYTPEIKNFVRTYQEYVLNAFDKLAPKITDSFLSKCCKTIDQLMTIDKFTFQEIHDSIKWASNDSFWSTQLKSLANIRANGKNGEKKFVNMFTAYKSKDAKPLNKSDQRTQSNLEVCRRFADGE